ncbi:hypothetical protein [Micromonospora sp. NPDC005367]|uniref:hypothetical protein n=1 Tax=Micromonospora sp. NPDC005367 TaxID=3155590 RepID=UPI0033ADE2B5
MITLKPLAYDFPDRMRGLSSAQREVARLERSMTVAYRRRDNLAFAYLDRRHQRARQVLAVIRQREQQAEDALAPVPGSSRRADACTDTSRTRRADR